MPDGAKLKANWKCCVKDSFNTLVCGSVFRSKSQVLIHGCEDGSIRLYNIPASISDSTLEPFSCLETKGGPVQCLSIHDVTKFGSLDLISGDSRGRVTIFSNGQILDRRHVTTDHSISCLQVGEDSIGNMSIIISDTGGVISGVLPFTQQWKTKLVPRTETRKTSGHQVSVKTIQAFSAPSSSAGITNYILASDNQSSLHVLQQGSVVLSLSAPSVVTAMCCGHFVQTVKTEMSDSIQQRINYPSQVALGCQNGAIYMFSDFQILPEMYVNVRLPIVQLKRISSIHHNKKDSLLCSGHFKSILLLHDGCIISKYEVSDLVVAMDIKENDDEKDEILVGCRDKSLYSLRVA